MKQLWVSRFGDVGSMLRLSARMLMGRRYWIVPLLPLAWSLWLIARLLLGWRATQYSPDDVQFVLIGFPLIVLAIALGVRIIAHEIDLRTLEVTYTVPGGAKRVWLWKLVAALAMLLVAELLLAGVSAVWLAAVPLISLYGALQGALFYLALAMTLGALFRGEIVAVLATVVILFLNLLATEFGRVQWRVSPLFNPGRLDVDPAQVLAWTLQNYAGFAIVIASLVLIAFARAERREKLLGL